MSHMLDELNKDPLAGMTDAEKFSLLLRAIHETQKRQTEDRDQIIGRMEWLAERPTSYAKVWWNNPPKMRELLEARNFLAHTIINTSNTVINSLSTVVILLCILYIDRIDKPYKWAWIAVAVVAIPLLVRKYGHNTPSKELRQSEKTLAELPFEG
jgi:hypothetical protein